MIRLLKYRRCSLIILSTISLLIIALLSFSHSPQINKELLESININKHSYYYYRSGVGTDITLLFGDEIEQIPFSTIDLLNDKEIVYSNISVLESKQDCIKINIKKYIEAFNSIRFNNKNGEYIDLYAGEYNFYLIPDILESSETLKTSPEINATSYNNQFVITLSLSTDEMDIAQTLYYDVVFPDELTPYVTYSIEQDENETNKSHITLDFTPHENFQTLDFDLLITENEHNLSNWICKIHIPFWSEST
ncbi:hypothetical protein NE562_09645 [Butyricicoccus faecihominis]|uniref:hypothetical protein n=1 Tax=Butyricicoccus faecihominis TaxID=1712515 RepID=UPI00247A301A|nr:hypothetical protein [Butyricicoccus faecihominis]MCQ5129923.1 hypothetical protein [Butyricicoccus faecihominis]